MNKVNMKNLLLALAALLFVFGMGVFKGQINGDRTFHKFTMEQGGEYAYTMDVGKMGIVKYLVEPNIMTLYLRCKVPANVEELRCEIEGLENFASQGSKKGVWKKLSPGDILQKGQWGDFVPLNLELAVPREDIYKYDIAKGQLRFSSKGKSYATLDIKIINSRYK